MQIRQSGMPGEAYWETLLDVELILKAFAIDRSVGNVVELGCGYGTFTLPVGNAISGRIYSYDLNETMVARTQSRAAGCGISNISCEIRDVVEHGFPRATLPAIDLCLLFNILHAENPVRLLQCASEVLRPGGRIAVIHWRYDATTPRGPSMDIRPRPQQIIKWADTAGGLKCDDTVINLPPWHYGIEFQKLN